MVGDVHAVAVTYICMCCIWLFYEYLFVFHGKRWRGGATGRVLDLPSTGRGFKSYSGQSCVTTLGKLFTPMCLCQWSVYLVPAKGWWCCASGKVTAGLEESNGSLPPGGWLIVTCALTACTLRSAPGPTLGNEYRKPLPFLTKTRCLVCRCIQRLEATQLVPNWGLSAVPTTGRSKVGPRCWLLHASYLKTCWQYPFWSIRFLKLGVPNLGKFHTWEISGKMGP